MKRKAEVTIAGIGLMFIFPVFALNTIPQDIPVPPVSGESSGCFQPVSFSQQNTQEQEPGQSVDIMEYQSLQLPQTVLPEDFLPYITAPVGKIQEEKVTGIVTPTSSWVVSGDVISSLGDYFTENKTSLGIKQITEVIAPPAVEDILPNWERPGYEYGYPLIPGWKGLKVEFERGGELWVFPTLEGNLAVVVKARNDSLREEMLNKFSSIVKDRKKTAEKEYQQEVEKTSEQPGTEIGLEGVESVGSCSEYASEMGVSLADTIINGRFVKNISIPP
ncbi:hypothetical protein J7K43_08710, partial [Candidatus Calescamantes bacterium]|nr:hypothetical protein [Candidatus Calescamantes bacterium]